MCGICGVINFNNEKPDSSGIQKMMKLMKHRGPDDEGIYINNNVGLGFVRLSIIDLSSGGHQPMISENGRYVIIYNGEIYNYLEIRKELRSYFTFHSNSDTEVLLNAYIYWGEDCLHKFNGMFSFVIYDNQTGKIFGARDRFGVKPFYYYISKNKFIFASEIQCILPFIETHASANNKVILDYLMFNRTDQTEETFFNQIFKLNHGHKFTISDNQFTILKWYQLKDHLTTPFQNPEEYLELLKSSISLRMRSDVPVGACLSGGLDSSSIVSIICKEMNIPDINTFSAVYDAGEEGDESNFIHEYHGNLKNMYFTKPSAEVLFKEMDQFISIQTEPLPTSSPYAQYKVMELAKNHVKVLLDGQGADEQLAGYHYFFGFYFKELLKQLKILTLANEVTAYINKNHSILGLKSFIYFLLPSLLKYQLIEHQHTCISKDFLSRFNYKDDAVINNIYQSKNLQDSLINHFEFKLEHLLKWEDRNSMFFSIESRVPFLDYRLVEKTLSLPNNMLLNKGTTKYILREAMKEILPERIRMRTDKIGFTTPEAKWFRTKKFHKKISDIINSEKFKNRGYFNVKNTQSLYNKHYDGSIDISHNIWKWINLELWFQKFIDN